MQAKEFRQLAKDGVWNQHTSGQCPGYMQANILILPGEYSEEFREFCRLNPQACPVLEVMEPGQYLTRTVANQADICTDIPSYDIFKNGNKINTVSNIKSYWQDSLVCFIFGCSFTFEHAFIREGIELRHINEGKNVSMYRSNIQCVPTERLSGNLIVSMRAIHNDQIKSAIEISTKYPTAHGGPIHIGDPGTIGIQDLSKPDYGDIVEIYQDETPLFWACGITPQQIIINAKPEIAITHSPGHMLITDLLID